ncbi:hypothetical protein HPB51_015395 [Rhipicephalus microplus]|uniref:HTH OST-type domain-containing protein n=1 Tax=Rhipicephalus microplus TaxID=6941 RepID=A0A9J6DVM8_RHIMP|nr:hypothetical protein HPB51_015395 [Rhipicephalus microplus]
MLNCHFFRFCHKMRIDTRCPRVVGHRHRLRGCSFGRYRTLAGACRGACRRRFTRRCFSIWHWEPPWHCFSVCCQANGLLHCSILFRNQQLVGAMECQQKQEVETFLHSVLSCEKNGIPLSKLQEEYTVLIGSPIPFQKFGFDRLIDYIKSIPNTAAIRKSPDNGSIVVQAVYKPVTAHVSQLVAGQKMAAKAIPARVSRALIHILFKLGASGSIQREFACYQSKLDNQKPSTTLPVLSPMAMPPRKIHRGTSRGLPPLRQPSAKPGFKYEVPPRWQRPRNGTAPAAASTSLPGNGTEEPVPRAPLRMPRTASNGFLIPPSASEPVPPSPASPPHVPPPPPKLPTPPPTPPAPKTGRELVEDYARSRNLEVSLSALSSRSSKKGPLVWLATLKVGVQSFNSYPDEKESREEAEEEAVRKAVCTLGLKDSELITTFTAFVTAFI